MAISSSVSVKSVTCDAVCLKQSAHVELVHMLTRFVYALSCTLQSRRELAHVMEKRKSEAEAHMKITDTALAALRLVALVEP
jgi:hypothetical protein